LSALRLELRPSAPFAAAIVAAHAAAGIALFLVLPAAPGVLCGIAFLALGAAAAWNRALLRARSSIRALEIEGASLTLELRDGRRRSVEAAARRYASRFLVAVPLRGPAGRTVLVVPGMLDAGSFRRLRLWTLWGRLPAVSATSVAGKQLQA
jgi:toxin CptA